MYHLYIYYFLNKEYICAQWSNVYLARKQQVPIVEGFRDITKGLPEPLPVGIEKKEQKENGNLIKHRNLNLPYLERFAFFS